MTTAAAAALLLAGAVPAPTTVVPDEVPDRGPLLSEPIARGELVLAPATTDPREAPKHVDGRIGDWAGTAAGIAGNAVWDRGEHIYTDFLFDAHGADDGGDRDRLALFAGALYEEERTWRLDQVLRTSGSQLGVPEPIGAADEYGDVAGGLDVGDLTEVRWALTPPDTHLELLVRVANLRRPGALGVLVLADQDDTALGDVGLGTGLTTDRFDRAVLLTGAGATARGTAGDHDAGAVDVAVSADGWDNALEAALPVELLAGGGDALDVAVVTGRIENDGTFTPLNAAYRHAEPVEIWNDRLQALGLLEGTVDRFSSGALALDDLRDGRTEPMSHLGPGYHERQMTSSEDISSEGGRDGILQPYGLYVPTAYAPTEALPITYWLHYRGGKAHSGTVINPRLTTQLGEEPGHLVVFPHARGTSEWYVTEAHRDVFEVMEDVETLVPEADPTRRYVSGYSMGGYGSWLFAALYPDLFAAAFVQSGAVTQGAWLGGGPDDEPDPFFGEGYVEANDGDARAQLTYRALENLRHVPFAIDHGTDDELVPITGIERMAARLTELGYAHRLTRYLGYEHFSQAAVDEWADGAAYLAAHVLDPDPRQVTYRVVPALVWSVNEIDPPADAEFAYAPDGAYWIDGIRAREVPLSDEETGRPRPDVVATVDAVATAIPAPERLPLIDTGTASPPGHSTPYLRSGLSFVDVPEAAGLAPEVTNGLELELSNVAAVAVDATRARLDLTGAAGTFRLTLTTDGASTVRLVGAVAGGWAGHVTEAGEGIAVSVDGDDLVITAARAGTHELTVDGHSPD